MGPDVGAFWHVRVRESVDPIRSGAGLRDRCSHTGGGDGAFQRFVQDPCGLVARTDRFRPLSRRGALGPVEPQEMNHVRHDEGGLATGMGSGHG